MNDLRSDEMSSTVEKKTAAQVEQYRKLYQQSLDEPTIFWAEQALQFISWFEPWTAVTTGNFNTLDINWFVQGKLNASYNCLDRHLPTRKNQIAIFWEGNSPEDSQAITYEQLYCQVNQFANVLKSKGIKKGDRVCIYLPMIPEVVISMLACARIGAIHSVVFGGFSADALKTRLLDCDCSLLITADEGLRAEKVIPFKINCDIALNDCPNVQTVIVVKRTGGSIPWNPTRDNWYHDEMSQAIDHCEVEHMDANDPLFILYTSGSTGKPKGVVHGTGGYLVYAAMTHYYAFDVRDHDIYWCTADVGWITGHTYLVYGPLLNGTSMVMYEGVPNYPNFSRYWEIIDKYQVSIFYTAPTAIRALRHEGNQWVKQTHRSSLRLLGSVGEPINPDVWEWYYHVIGDARCPIVNTWWQTETGGIMLLPFPHATQMKPGGAGVPFFGVEPDIVDDEGHSIDEANQTGKLVIKRPWPGLMQTIYHDKARFFDTYFKPVPGCYLTGDGAYRDQDGLYWITGRDDDVIKVSGHRIGTEELESAFISHSAVSEVAVVGVPHPIKGEGIFAFVTIGITYEKSDALKNELVQHVRNKIGALATPEAIQWTRSLPKTRSGKIMRRILRHIASNQQELIGDISTLADAEVIDEIIRSFKHES